MIVRWRVEGGSRRVVECTGGYREGEKQGINGQGSNGGKEGKKQRSK